VWVDVDVAVPYAAGELLARVRERGTVEVEYGERDVRIHGRVAPSLAGELEAVARRWTDAMEGAGSADAVVVAGSPSSSQTGS
ncbi:MAG: hypothetical protein ACRDIL_10400, partial [Candidatus Limnocylindrales bacterium]